LRLAPQSARAWSSFGDLLAREGQEIAAEGCLRRSADLDTYDPIVRLKLGQWMVQTARHEEAIGFFNDVRRLAPWIPDAISGLAQTFISQGRLDDAEPLLRQVLETNGAHLDSRLALARLLLLKGDYARGWPAYEWRRRRLDAKISSFSVPEWDGAPISGKTLLVHIEQGLGDVIQFLRFIPLLAARGIKVVLLIRPELQRLCRSLAPIAEICCEESSLPAFDFHIPLLSVPWRLQIDLDRLPADVPYLSVAPTTKLPAPSGTRLKVGLVWAGEPTQGNDRLRSATLEPLLSLADIPGIALYSLQVGSRAADLQALAHPDLVFDMAPRLRDLADTADVIGQLDLVITVDTAVAHLAGALGKPVWVMLSFAPDWRWMLGRDDMPWYPSMRLFRQTVPRQWDDVIARVGAALARLAASSKEPNPDPRADVTAKRS
jgi:tetratricopeptide (TPR) repeat protein